MARGRRIDPEMRAAIEEACREAVASGVGSRNSIAVAYEVSPSVVTGICRRADPPILWDRSATRAATAAHAVDQRARRHAISDGLLNDIDQIRGMLFQPRPRMTRSGDVVQVAPDPSDIRNLFIALGIAIDKHAQLTTLDVDDRDLSAVDAWIDTIMGQ